MARVARIGTWSSMMRSFRFNVVLSSQRVMICGRATYQFEGGSARLSLRLVKSKIIIWKKKRQKTDLQDWGSVTKQGDEQGWHALFINLTILGTVSPHFLSGGLKSFIQNASLGCMIFSCYASIACADRTLTYFLQTNFGQYQFFVAVWEYCKKIVSNIHHLG